MKFLGIIFGIFFSVCLLAQEGVFHITYDVNSALGNNIVYDMIEGKDGELYFACESGVWTYNGISFNRLKYHGNSKFEGSYFKKDKDNRIWMINFDKGIARIDEELKEVKDFTIAGVSFDKIRGFHISDSKLYYHTVSSLYQVDLITHEKELILPQGEDMVLLGFMSESGMLAGQYYGDNSENHPSINYMVNLNSDDPKIEPCYFDIMPNQAHMINGEFYFSHEESNSEKGMSYLISQNGQDSIILSPLHDTRVVQERYSEDLGWLFATSSGLYVADQKEVWFPNYFCTDVLEDNEDNLWVSTLNHGVIFIPSTEIYSYGLQKELEDVQPDRVFYDSKRDELYFSDYTTGDLYKKTIDGVEFIWNSPFKRRIKNILWYDQDQSHLLVSDISPYIFDIETYQYENNEELGIGTAFIDATMRAFVNKNRVYFYDESKDFEVDSLKLKEEGLVQLMPCKYCGPNQYNILIQPEVSFKTILPTANTIWLVKQDSLIGISSTHMTVDSRQEFNGIQDVKEFGGQLFVRLEEEILLLNVENNQVEKSFPLSSDSYFNDYYLNEKYLVLSYENYLEIIDYKLGPAKVFPLTIGGEKIKVNDVFLLDELMFLSTVTDILKIKLDDLDFQSKLPRLEGGVPSLELDHDHEPLDFNFKVTSYCFSGNLYYRISESTQSWTKLPEGTSIIQNLLLPPGTNTVEVYYENSLGQRSEKVQFTVNVSRPYYQSWWFFITVALTFLVLVVIIYKYQVAKIRKKKNLEKELEEAKLLSLKSQMNPHFIFNALNSIQHLVAFDKNDEAYHYILKFSSLLREILNYSNQESIPVAKEMEIISDYLEIEQMRFHDDFSFEIICPKELGVLNIPSMMIQPFVENALKHGVMHKKGEKRVKVTLKRVEETIVCSIEDNGIGFKKSKEINRNLSKTKTSLTHKNTEERLKLYEQLRGEEVIKIQDITNASGDCLGAKVTLVLPLIS